MLQVNLSNLSGPELRRLLDATRSRGEAALSYQILQEMAARREDGGLRGPFHARRRKFGEYSASARPPAVPHARSPTP